MTASVDTRNFTRRPAPGLPYQKMVQAILPGWDISLVFAGKIRARNLNVQLRNKDYIPNVLSYALGKKSGELILCPPIIKQQAPGYGLSYTDCTAFMFIHGLLHLKGLPHGTTMERYERELVSRFTGVTISGWLDASQPASISARTKRKSSLSKR